MNIFNGSPQVSYEANSKNLIIRYMVQVSDTSLNSAIVEEVNKRVAEQVSEISVVLAKMYGKQIDRIVRKAVLESVRKLMLPKATPKRSATNTKK